MTGRHPCRGCGNLVPEGVGWCGGCTEGEPSTQHLRRMVFTEAGRMMLTDEQAAAYRAELEARR